MEIIQDGTVYQALDDDGNCPAQAELMKDGLVLISCEECGEGPSYAPAEHLTDKRVAAGMQDRAGRSVEDLLAAVVADHTCA